MQPMFSIEEATQLLCETRRKLGVSQEELAERCGLKRSVIADIETGRRRIQREAGAAIWDALHEIHEERIQAIPGQLKNLEILLSRYVEQEGIKA